MDEDRDANQCQDRDRDAPKRPLYTCGLGAMIRLAFPFVSCLPGVCWLGWTAAGASGGLGLERGERRGEGGTPRRGEITEETMVDTLACCVGAYLG